MAKVKSTFADAWKPTTPGDKLEGLYVGKKNVEGGRSDSFTSYHIKTETGTFGVAGASLESMFAQIPKKTMVTVVFKGMTDTKSGPMRDFEVEVPDGTQLLDPYEDDND